MPSFETLVDRYAAGDHDARSQLIAGGEAAIAPLLRAYEAKRIADWSYYGVLRKLGDAGERMFYDAAARDDDEGACAVRCTGNENVTEERAVHVVIGGLSQSHPAKQLAAVVALVTLFPKVAASTFDGAGDALLRLAANPSDSIRTNALQAIRLVKPDAKAAIPLCRLAVEHGIARSEFTLWHNGVSAIAAYGPAALECLPLLITLLARFPHVNTVRAIGELGAGAASAVPALLAAREAFHSPLKSDIKQFQKAVDQVVKALTSQTKKEKPRAGDPEVLALLDRFQGADHDRARREALALNDPIWVPKIASLLQGRYPKKNFHGLVTMLAGVIANTHAEPAVQLLLDLMRVPERNPAELLDLTWAASHGLVAEAAPLIGEAVRTARMPPGYQVLMYLETRPDIGLQQVLADWIVVNKANRETYFVLAHFGNYPTPVARFAAEDVIRWPELGYRTDHDTGMRGLAFKILLQLADPVSLPVFLDELERFQPASIPFALHGISLLAGRSVLPAMLRAWKRLPAYVRNRGDAFLPCVHFALTYFAKVDEAGAPEVLDVQKQLLEQRHWEKLADVERQAVMPSAK